MSAGLYFSAHWCPPCRGFTPELAKFYNEMKKKVGDKLEIVFISSDRSEADWKGYFAEMPWLALPFSARDIKVGSLLPDSGAEYCDNVSCVCLSVCPRAYLPNYVMSACQTFTNFSAHYLWPSLGTSLATYNTICTSGFMDDVTGWHCIGFMYKHCGFNNHCTRKPDPRFVVTKSPKLINTVEHFWLNGRHTIYCTLA